MPPVTELAAVLEHGDDARKLPEPPEMSLLRPQEDADHSHCCEEVASLICSLYVTRSHDETESEGLERCRKGEERRGGGGCYSLLKAAGCCDFLT